MKNTKIIIGILAVVIVIVGISSYSSINAARNQIKELTAGDATIAANLAKFDTLDYTVFSNQEWTRIHESHAKDIKVYWPDGHVTVGLGGHIEDLKAMFVYAPLGWVNNIH